MKIGETKQEALSFEEANRLLRYDPDAGKLFWRVNRKRRKAGDVAGSIAPTTGRPVITINGRNYFQSRVAWLLHYGRWPTRLVDHENRNVLDTTIKNLRLADEGQNGANRGAGKLRQMGSLKGASITKRGTWRSSIKIKGKTRNLGDFHTELEAHQAYVKAAKVAFNEFARAA